VAELKQLSEQSQKMPNEGTALSEESQGLTLPKWQDERHLGARHAFHGGFLGQYLGTMIDKSRPQSEKRCIIILSGKCRINNVALNIGDTPEIPVVDTMDLTIGTITDKVDVFNLVFDFNLYLAVRITEAMNGSDTVYTQRGVAVWQFDGSGTIDASGNWTRTGAENTGMDSVLELQNGDIVPIIIGTSFNYLLPGTWTY